MLPGLKKWSGFRRPVWEFSCFEKFVQVAFELAWLAARYRDFPFRRVCTSSLRSRLAGCRVGSSLEKVEKVAKMVGFRKVSEDPFGTFPVSTGLSK